MDQSHSTKFDRLFALAVREQRTRFAGGALGVLWAYFNPIFWIGFVVVFFQFVGRTPPIAAGPEIFVATGILPYSMFRQTITAEVRIVVANRYMSYLAPTSDTELMQASALLEMVNIALTSLLILTAVSLIFAADAPADLGRVYLAIMLVWTLAVGVGSLFSVLSKLSDTFSRLVPVVLRPAFWISGIFFTATELGASLQAIFWWNPLLQCVELLREGFFLGYQSPIAAPWYPAVFGAICMVLAATIERLPGSAQWTRHRI